MASFLYTRCITDMISGQSGHVNLVSDTIKVMLLKSTYSAAKTHDFVSDIVANEADCTGYTGGFSGAGRKQLSSNNNVSEQTISSYTASVFDSDTNPSWTALGSGNTLGGAVVFHEDTNDASSPLICWLDFSPDISTNGGDLTITWAAAASGGIAYIGC